MSDEKKTAFVTGATGFLGGHLCQQLIADGWRVRALVRRPTDGLADGVQSCKGDLLDHQSLLDSIENDTDAVFHVGADTNTWRGNNARQTRINIDGTRGVLEACRQRRVKRLVHVSTAAVYGVDHTHEVALAESQPKDGLHSRINYVASKTRAEALVLDAAAGDVDAVIVNPTHIIGPGDRHNWARLFCMIADQSLPAIPAGSGSFADVRDVAASTIAAHARGRRGENYLLGGHNHSFTEFIAAAAAELGVAVTAKRLPQGLLRALATAKDLISRITRREPDLTPESLALISHRYRCDSARAIEELGHRIRPFEDSIRDAVNSLRADGLINTAADNGQSHG